MSVPKLPLCRETWCHAKAPIILKLNIENLKIMLQQIHCDRAFNMSDTDYMVTDPQNPKKLDLIYVDYCYL